mmetsp:Transcript_113576/g.316004  ORF Transcript_113576/g.316004 Transcript_113576/m.316004 type:complete len:354 (+) Transcript_113576:103-1164(+)
MAPAAADDDYYRLLGVGRGASDGEIVKAYKRLALKHHPDKNPDDPETAEQMFKRISEAYSVLCDAEKRRKYDLLGSDPPRASRRSGNFTRQSSTGSTEQAEDFFSAFAGVPRGVPYTGRGIPSAKDFGSPLRGKEDPLAFFASAHRGRGSVDDLRSGMFRRSYGGTSGDCATRFAASQPSWFRPPTAFAASPDWAIPLGRSVTIRGLARAPEHNGKVGTVMKFDEGRCRYDVEVIGVGKLSLKPQSLTQRCRIEVVDMDSKPGMNGRTGDVLAFDFETGLYTVMMQYPPSVLVLPRGNCRLSEGVRVLTLGLSVDRYNGQMAKIVDVDAFARRYRLHLKDGQEVKVKFDKVVC